MEVNLSAGPPFPRQPGDTAGAARELFARAGGVQAATGDVRAAHAPASDAVEADLLAPMESAPTPAIQNAQVVSDASLFAAGALQIFDTAVQNYNGTVDDLNRRWSELEDDPAAPTDDTDGRDAHVARQAALRSELQAEQQRAQTHLDGGADDVAGLLRAGPTAMADPTIWQTIMAAVAPLAHPDPPPGWGSASDLRTMTLNIGGGVDYFWPSDKGFDDGDVEGLAQRILDGEVDVANLQEVFSGHARALENELERQSGDDWTLTFADASTKFPMDSLPFGESFGNAVLVRAPEDGSTGSTGLSVVDSTTAPILDGPDEGRSMAAVTVETANGQRVTFGTSHTDYTGVSDADQAEQLEQFRQGTEDFAAETGGDHTVLTGDLNHEIDEDHPAGETLRSWQDDYDNAAAPIESTHAPPEGKTIDYIWTSDGLDYDDVERVHGDHPDVPGRDDEMSDHDGIAVDLNLPYSDSADDNDPPPDDDSDEPGLIPTPDPEPNDPQPEPTEPSPEPGPAPTPPDD